MNVVVKIVVALIVGLVSRNLEAQNTYNITVIIKEVTNDKGQMFLALYNSETDFLEKELKGAKSKIVSNSCTVTIENIPAGVYAVSVFHDENDNGKMDTNFMGIPKEDFGCSNDAKGLMGPPKWNDAKFELQSDTSITIHL